MCSIKMQFSSLSSNNHIISRYFFIEQKVYKKQYWKIGKQKKAMTITILENKKKLENEKIN